jgi:hypothetical protein
MTLKNALTQIGVLERKAQTLRLRLAQQKIIPQTKNVWQSTAGVMSWQKGQRMLKKIASARKISDQKLSALLER